MDFSDPRAVLGLPSDATRAEAQRAFRRLAKQTHPDAGGDPAAFRAVAGAWGDLAAVLPPARRPRVVSPHVRAYRPTPSRVVWTEPRPSAGAVASQRVNGSGTDFARILKAEMARHAA
jgi:DnaJ domain